MTKKIHSLLLSAALIVLSSCNSTNLEVYYNSEMISPECYEPISNDANPQVLETSDFESAKKRYLSSGYIVLGSMNFVGERVTQGELADFAKLKGSSLVILVSQQKGTITRSYLVPHTTSSTSYTSGNISNTNYSSPMNSLNYTERTTTSSTEWQERTYKVGRYEVTCIFLAKKR